MKVFVTGASGFIGSAIVKELLSAGHDVIGLARSDESAKAIQDAGAKVLKGSLNNLEAIRNGASMANGVIHTAFIHDFNQYAKAAETDKEAIAAMGEALKGTSKPLIVTGGILGVARTNGFVTEADAAPPLPRASEVAAMELAKEGVHASVVRLPPSVHDRGDKGFIPVLIGIARQKGISAYVGDGNNRWPSVHRLDAARLFRLALEKSDKGALYNAVGDQGIALRDIAGLISKKLGVTVKSITPEEATEHFDWMGRFITFDNPATSYKTQDQLGWKATHIGLLEDMERNYF
ncbi:MAG: 3-beta hydroxysteroid dehydrogenase [Bacteroidetes bacterium]|nr:MAG: 3-beta hydroxysteroid dehydrogenase [Bacteroidota bacterium]